MTYKTEQEKFWAEEFGDKYIERNRSQYQLAANINFFSNIFQRTESNESLIEFGANVGMNLQAIKTLLPDIKLSAIEINPKAAEILQKNLSLEETFVGSIFDYSPQNTFDIVLIKGVLIHINPKMLSLVYDKLYQTSKKYILICEYYNRSPVVIPYRGHTDRLFKRDFAGEMLEKYQDLRLRDYGFVYHRDPNFPQDDITWFLMEKEEQ